MRIVFLLVAVPLIELFLLLKLADLTSWPFTILVTLFTWILGASLARRQGFSTIHRIQSEMSKGRVPATSIVDAVMILCAGLLLMTPGILTDVFGFSLLIPIARTFYRTVALSWFRDHVKVETFTTKTSAKEMNRDQDEIIDSYVISDDSKQDDRAS